MQENNEEVIYGKNNVMDTIKIREISKVFIQKDKKSKEIVDLIATKNIPYVYVEKKYLDQLTQHAAHQGIGAIVSPTNYLELNELINKNKSVENPMVILLDEVQDVNNLGAIIRIVDSFGINGLIFNKRRNAQLNGAVAKISTGAINHIDIVRVTNLSQTIEKMKKLGYWIAYLDMDGKTKVQDFDFDLPLVVVVGGEDKGVTNNIKKHCDFGITIDMFGHVNSLNVASATSVLCYQKSTFKKEK